MSVPRQFIRCARLFTGLEDQVRHAQTLVVENGLFTHVGPTAAAPQPGPQDTVLDAAAHFVMPGMVDVHTHLVFGGDRAARGRVHRGVNARAGRSDPHEIVVFVSRSDDMRRPKDPGPAGVQGLDPRASGPPGGVGGVGLAASGVGPSRPGGARQDPRAATPRERWASGSW